jgi:hypothetical protein
MENGDKSHAHLTAPFSPTNCNAPKRLRIHAVNGVRYTDQLSQQYVRPERKSSIMQPIAVRQVKLPGSLILKTESGHPVCASIKFELFPKKDYSLSWLTSTTVL